MLLRKILITASALALVACTGVLEPRGGGGGAAPGPGQDVDADVGPGPDVGDTPQALFLNDISNRLEDKCAGCHAEGGNFEPFFLTQSKDNYYDKIMAGYPNNGLVGTDTASSVLYTKGQTPHGNDVVWSDGDNIALTQWIDGEFAYRQNVGGGGGEPVPDPAPGDCPGLDDSACALQKFGQCFTQANWEQYQPYQIANVQSAQGTCQNCHNDERGGFYASDDYEEMYQKWQQTPFVQKLVEASLDGNGQFAGLIKSYRFRDKGAEPGHPGYTLPTELEDQINGFIDATLEAYENGPCQ